VKGTEEDILYLDFDGVLHHENVLWRPLVGPYLSAPDGCLLFQHAELLERLLEPCPRVQIWSAPRGHCGTAAAGLQRT